MASVHKRAHRPTFYAKYRDRHGNWIRRSTGTTDLRTARRVAKEWESQELLRREGVIDPRADELAQHDRVSLKDHIESRSFQRVLSVTLLAIQYLGSVGNDESILVICKAVTDTSQPIADVEEFHRTAVEALSSILKRIAKDVPDECLNAVSRLPDEFVHHDVFYSTDRHSTASDDKIIHIVVPYHEPKGLAATELRRRG